MLAVDPEEGLGAIELCLAARAFGTHLASTPFLGSAALRFAAGTTGAFDELGDARVSVALLEPGSGWSVRGALTSTRPVDGRKVAVEHADEVDHLAVVATSDGSPALALVATAAAGVEHEPQASLDIGVPLHTVTFSGADAEVVLDGDQAGVVLTRLTAIGALLAAAESVGAAGRMLEDARAYAAQRRQFGRTIGSNQALRHILADMYVRQASAWSTVLYAAAALDDDLSDADADGGSRQGLRGTRRSRGGTRRDPGLRWRRLHRRASGTPLPAADRRPRAAVRRRRASRARTRPRPRGDDPAARRRSRPDPRQLIERHA